MESLENLKEKLPEPYAISVNLFEMPPKELDPYNPGDKVTRENFLNFLIRSFAISRGQMAVQLDFMVWLKFKNGFDYSQTFTNFIQAGGWNILSKEEQEEFMLQFNKVNKTGAHEGFQDLIKEEMEKIEKNANRLNSSKFDGKNYISNISTFDEFAKYAADKVMIEKYNKTLKKFK